ncbi:MAG: hypothetical protein WC807_10365 [Hyphomicrobium sp.]
MPPMSQVASASTEATIAASASIDTSDVPLVGTRELVLALKMLTSGKGLLIPPALSDLDLRQVEQAFWQISRRSRQRKIAVLLRFRSLVTACQSRRVSELIAEHGQAGVILALEVAATMRLNAKWGFNPHKMARAMREALASAGEYFPESPVAA